MADSPTPQSPGGPSTPKDPPGDTPGDSPGDNTSDSDDSDIDTHNLVVAAARTKARNVSEKRRLDDSAFDSWLSSLRDDVFAGPPPPQPGTTAPDNDDNDSRALDEYSVPSLIHQQTAASARIIHSPREYQIELFERAKAQNSIVVLDTGSGKTLIAALLLRHTLEQELEDRARGNPPRTAFFLVDKVALVFQQFAVLEANLDHPITKLCGAMVDDRWSADFWQHTTAEHRVVVCTAAILLKALSHSFVKIKDINLLILDEAHHAKGHHPYAAIVRDFYNHEPDPASRPRIMGMTASPVDVSEEILPAAIRLEKRLHSQIVTVSDDALAFSRVVKDQEEKVLYYPPAVALLNGSSSSEYSPLYLAIEAQVGLFAKQFRRMFRFARDAVVELGPWEADRLWHLCLTETELDRLEAACEFDRQRAGPVSALYRENPHAAIASVRTLLAESSPQPPLLLSSDHLSPKVLLLVKTLHELFALNQISRCMVFVQRRYTAFMLHDLFQHDPVKLPGLLTAPLVGENVEAGGPVTMSYRSQVLTLAQFRRGEVNCLFSTSVAEEGIDIAECDVIIRFDLYDTMIQYIQSKGRARRQKSLYINMAEHGNPEHYRKMKNAELDARALKRFCAEMPEDRKISSHDTNLDSIRLAREQKKFFVVKETGAKLTYPLALDVLAAFVSSLPHPDGCQLVPQYAITTRGDQFVCEIVLPEASPVRSKVGFAQPRKQTAKCSAAFELCLELLAKKYIDKHLQPTFTKKLPAMRNARLAVSSNKQNEYDMKMKPAIWAVGLEETPSTSPGDIDTNSTTTANRSLELHAVALVLDNPDALDRPSTPLILLTRAPLPALPAIPLFFRSDQTSNVRVVPLCSAVFTPEQVEGIATYTLRIFRDVFSKWYELDVSKMPYFLVPSALSHEDLALLSPRPLLDKTIRWPDIHTTRNADAIPWNLPGLDFANRFITDPYDGSRKMYSVAVRPDMTPHSAVPDWVPAPKHRGWKTAEHNVIEYSCSLWTRTRAARTWQADQPVVEAELTSLRRNLLDDNAGDVGAPARCFVILEALTISTLRPDVVASAFTIPAIIHRIESVLIALEGCRLFNLDINPYLALEAFTKDSDNTEEHDVEKVNFQGGMGNNYERLEFLGDTFLKMATTISIFTQRPDCNEFEYHVERMLLICNQNLFNAATALHAEQYIRSHAFDRRAWYPPGLKLTRGKAPKTAMRHALADKTIADVCEAMIGAAYLTGIDRGNDGNGHVLDLAVQAVTAMVRHKNHTQTRFAEYFETYIPPAWHTAPPPAVYIDLAAQIAKSTGYQFRSPALVRSAFKHASYPYDVVPSYQRLEFLGDALLDMVAVDHLFQRYPGANPQWLTEHKMAMVSNQFLGCLAVTLGFHRHVLTTHAALQAQVREYDAELTAARDSGTSTSHGYWVDVKDPPKVLADVLEAVLGAIFVDAEYSLGPVRAFFTQHMRPFFQDMALYDSFAGRHPVAALTQLLDIEAGCRAWRVLVREVPAPVGSGAACLTETRVACGLLVHGRVVQHATAASGRYAKRAMANRALGVLREGAGREALRGVLGCDCVGGEQQPA